jgi:hypothetical protein
MLVAMSTEPTTRFQIITPKAVHKRLKVEAADLEIDMSDLGTVLLRYGLDLIDGGKLPAPLKAAIEEAQAAKGKKAEEE